MKKVILICLIFTAVLGYSQAMEIDIDKAISLVKENNIDLKRSSLELYGKKRGVQSSFNVFYPTLSGSAIVSRSNTEPDPIAAGTPYEFTPDATNLVANYKAQFIFTPALFDAITLLKRDYELGEITYEQSQARIEKEVKVAFYNTILLKESISLLEDNLKTIQARYDLTKTNYEAGLVSELDLLQVQVSLENFKPELSNMRKIYNTSILNFKMFMGIPFEQEIEIIGEIEPEINEITYEEALQKAMENSDTLKLLNKSEELLFAQKKTIFNRNFLPVVGVEYSQGTVLNDPYDFERWEDEDNFVDDTGNFSFFLNYSFTALLPMSKERMEIEEIERSIQDLGLQRNATLDGIKLQIMNHIETLNTSITIQRGLELTVELAKKSLDRVEQAYKAGTVQVLEVENAENEYKKARLELVKEKFNYLNAWLELNSIIE